MSLGNKETMAKNIKRLMTLNHVNATDVCTALGFKAPTFSDWVNAKTYPRIDKIEAMSNYFGVSKADLVEEPKDPIDPVACALSDDDLALLEKYRTLDEYGKEIVELVLDAEHRRVGEQQDAVNSATRNDQCRKVNHVDNLDNLLPSTNKGPTHI